jgi:hypothetical protein
MTDPSWPYQQVPPMTGWTTPGPTVAPARIAALRSAGMAATIMLALVAAVDLADLVLTPLVVADPNGSIATVELLVLLLEVFCVLATAIAFITWLVIATRNLRSWRLPTPYGPGWAIGAWLIPVANLVVPVVVVNQTARGSATAPVPNLPPQRANRALIWSWWGCLIVSGLFARVAAGQTFATDEGAYAMGAGTPGTAFFVAAAVLAILVIRHINDLQARRQAALDAMWQQPPMHY